MMRGPKCKDYKILGLLLLSTIFFIIWNFIPTLKPAQIGVSRSPSIRYRIGNVSTHMVSVIERKLQEMTFARSNGYKGALKSLKEELRLTLNSTTEPSTVWSLATSWVTPHQVTPENAPELGSILKAMSVYPIKSADFLNTGTRLKLLLTLPGNQSVIFKPKWYKEDFVWYDAPYAGHDRHNGEIAAFHMCRILGLHRCPLVVGRRVNLRKEIQKVATPNLAKAFETKGKNVCFAGKCQSCRRFGPACGDGETMDGALILFLPFALKVVVSPWKRIYRPQSIESWEKNANYCQTVKFARPSMHLDLVDACVLDYLIGNADRHDCEFFKDAENSSCVMVDNGKSFSNPSWDEVSILAPLYQCCRIRRKTFDRLELFVDNLGSALEELLTFDPLAPVLTKPHLDALDRRLKAVLATIAICIEKEGNDHTVIVS